MSATAEKLAAEDRVYFPMRDKSLKDESGVYDIADVASPMGSYRILRGNNDLLQARLAVYKPRQQQACER